MISHLQNSIILILSFSLLSCSDTEISDYRTSSSNKISQNSDPTKSNPDDKNNDDAVSPGEDGTASLPSDVGIISNIAWNGYITGYAYKKDSPESEVDVEVFINGTSEPSLITTADQAGFINGVEGNHRFSLSLPADEFEDGKEVSIGIFANLDGELVELSNSPMKKTIYKPKAKSFYESDVASKLSSCGSSGCHSGPATWTYELAIERLAKDPPHEGGTGSNNDFYFKASGGDSHAGGNRCASVAGLCEAIQSWWEEEFSTP